MQYGFRRHPWLDAVMRSTYVAPDPAPLTIGRPDVANAYRAVGASPTGITNAHWAVGVRGLRELAG